MTAAFSLRNTVEKYSNVDHLGLSPEYRLWWQVRFFLAHDGEGKQFMGGIRTRFHSVYFSCCLSVLLPTKTREWNVKHCWNAGLNRTKFMIPICKFMDMGNYYSPSPSQHGTENYFMLLRKRFFLASSMFQGVDTLACERLASRLL